MQFIKIKKDKSKIFKGVGRGIALELGRAGATVYTTALEPSKEDLVVRSVASKLPTLDQTVKEVIFYQIL